jgi:hypothetical protein
MWLENLHAEKTAIAVKQGEAEALAGYTLGPSCGTNMPLFLLCCLSGQIVGHI